MDMFRVKSAVEGTPVRDLVKRDFKDFNMNGNKVGIGQLEVIDLAVFDDIKDDFTIMTQEPFGPLVPMLSFKTFDEVIERANNNDLGLCSYIYTNSMEQAHRASELIETGCVAVNTAAVAVAEAPFGGIKQTVDWVKEVS